MLKHKLHYGFSGVSTVHAYMSSFATTLGCLHLQVLDQPSQTLTQAGLANMEMLIVTKVR